MEFEGIVLRVTPFKEKDAMVNVLTSTGVLSFMARGVLSIENKNAASLTQYAFSRFEFSEGKGTGLSLKNGTLIKSYDESFKSLDRLAALSVLGELTLHGVGEDEAASIYPYFKNALEAIESGFDLLTTVIVFFAQVLKAAGYGLEVGHCVFCDSTKDIVAVSYPDGGFVCKNDLDAETMHPTDARYLKIIRYLFMVGPEDVKRVAFTKEECLGILNEFKEYASDQLGLSLKGHELLIRSLKK